MNERWNKWNKYRWLKSVMKNEEWRMKNEEWGMKNEKLEEGCGLRFTINNL